MFALVLELTGLRALKPLLSYLLRDWLAIRVITPNAIQQNIAKGFMDSIYSQRNRRELRVEPDEWIAERPIPSYKISR
jgi:hypothetical protein